MNDYAYNSTLRRPRQPMKRTAIKRSSVTLRTRRESSAETKFKKAVRERDDYTCQFTDCKAKSADVDHKGKRSQRPDLKLDVDNGICLCREHHGWTDHNRAEAIRLGLLATETYELAKKRAA